MIEKSAGGIIINNGKAVIVSQRGVSFSLPKGHIDGDESPIEAAYREIYEETGLKKEDLIFVKEFGKYTRMSGRTKNPKEIHMFLFKTQKLELKPIDMKNPEAKWVAIDEVADHLTLDKDKEFFIQHKKEYYNLSN